MDKKPRINTQETLNILAIAGLILHMVFASKGFLFLTLLFLILNTFKNRLADRIADLWMGFSHLLGEVMSRVILSLIFFLFLTPLACMVRLFHPALGAHFKTKKEGSYFEECGSPYTKEDFKNLW